MLRTHSQNLMNAGHLVIDAAAIDDCLSTCGWHHPSQNRSKEQLGDPQIRTWGNTHRTMSLTLWWFSQLHCVQEMT